MSVPAVIAAPDAEAVDAMLVLRKRLRVREFRDRSVETLLMLAALVAVFTTAAIVYILVSESIPFFAHVSLR